ncbi:MAG: GNAT family N-acetyltransferase, partial [Pseudomonadota bacterium]
DRRTIANLPQLMLYDLSPIDGEWIGGNGRYAYRWLDLYWTEPGRNAYLFTRNGQLSGFALVLAYSPLSGCTPCWFMAEFYILRAQRHLGYGKLAASEIIARHPGNWEIAVLKNNQNAISFWTATLSRLPLTDLKTESQTHDARERVVHSFISPRSAAR